MPVPGVAKPQSGEAAEDLEAPVEVASGTAVNWYEYPLACAVVAKLTPVIPTVYVDPAPALALMSAGVILTGADCGEKSDETVEVLVGVVEPLVQY